MFLYICLMRIHSLDDCELFGPTLLFAFEEHQKFVFNG